VLDRSGSIHDSDALDDVQDTAIDFVEEMDLEVDQVGLVTFNDDASLDQELTQDLTAIKDAINAIEAAGGTDIAAGIAQATEELNSSRRNPEALPVIILLTDGLAKGEEDATRAAAEVAKEQGVRLITIGLGEEIDAEMLETIASETTDYWPSPASEDLAAIYKAIAEEINCEVDGES
jgi:Mg-chelatase subunit ChlD